MLIDGLVSSFLRLDEVLEFSLAQKSLSDEVTLVESGEGILQLRYFHQQFPYVLLDVSHR